MSRVLRGGSWNNNPNNARAANRNRNNPDNWNNNVGVRCAKASQSARADGSESLGLRTLGACQVEPIGLFLCWRVEPFRPNRKRPGPDR